MIVQSCTHMFAAESWHHVHTSIHHSSVHTVEQEHIAHNILWSISPMYGVTCTYVCECVCVWVRGLIFAGRTRRWGPCTWCWWMHPLLHGAQKLPVSLGWGRRYSHASAGYSQYHHQCSLYDGWGETGIDHVWFMSTQVSCKLTGKSSHHSDIILYVQN